jgi:aspartate racemase
MRWKMKTIGIIGGMGPLATVHLYERIVLRTKALRDQDHIRVLIDSNTNIPDRTKAIISDGEDPTVELIKSAKILENSGADFLIMPCNTAHYFINTIQEAVNIPFINMVEETVKYTEKKFGKDTVVGILATDGTIKSKIYENYYANLGIKTVVPDKTQTDVMKFIYDVIKKGNYNEGTSLMFSAVEELKEMGATSFLLGCTELSSAQYMYKFEGNFINPIEVLTERSIEFAGGQLN